jgi:hypothetical protein
MKTTITKQELELLTFLKSAQDQLERLSNRMYYYTKKLLELESDDWLTDYFNNNLVSVTEFLNQENIEVEENETEDATD